MARANPQEDEDLRDFLQQMDAIRLQPPQEDEDLRDWSKYIRLQPPQQPSTGNPNVDDALGQHFQQLSLQPPQQRGGAGPTAQIARPRPRPSSNQPASSQPLGAIARPRPSSRQSASSQPGAVPNMLPGMVPPARSQQAFPPEEFSGFHPPSRPIPVRPQPALNLCQPRSPRANPATVGGSTRASRSFKEAERWGGRLPGDHTYQTSRFDNPEMTPFNPNLGDDILATFAECQMRPESPGASRDRDQWMYAVRQITKMTDELTGLLRNIYRCDSPDQQPAAYYHSLQAMWRFEYICQMYKTCNIGLPPEVFAYSNLGFDSLRQATSDKNRSVAALSRLAQSLQRITKVLTEMIEPARQGILGPGLSRQSQLNIQMSTRAHEEDTPLMRR